MDLSHETIWKRAAILSEFEEGETHSTQSGGVKRATILRFDSTQKKTEMAENFARYGKWRFKGKTFI
jgi:hypothetical protein